MPGHRFVAYHGQVYGRLDLRSFLCFIQFIKSLKTGFEFTHNTKGAKQICAGRMPNRVLNLGTARCRVMLRKEH